MTVLTFKCSKQIEGEDLDFFKFLNEQTCNATELIPEKSMPEKKYLFTYS